MSSFTPGPWRVEKIHDLWTEIRSGHGISNTMIADCVSEANARLIAAAPDLLAALQACDEAMIYMSEYDIPIMLPAQVKAAIRKATGKECDGF
jgi:UDP-3-O-acyl-N-acetylglucosamine deacetylase